MWSAYLFKMTTGEIGPRLSFESMDWSIELNGTETVNMRLRKSELPSVDRNYWLSPWWAGVALFWDDKPIVAGPILARPAESFQFVTLSCGGMRSILAKRILVQELRGNWDSLPHTEIYYNNLGLGTIAKRVVAASQGKFGGMLPISYPMADEGIIPAGLPLCQFEDGTAGPNPCYWDASKLGNGVGQSFAWFGTTKVYASDTHERTYKGFNVSNLSVDDVLKKLSDVINGPDIMFKPRLLRPGLLTFDLWTGTEVQPRIAQKFTPVWDTTPEKGQVSEMNVVTTGTYQTSRVFATGSGQDEGTMIRVSEDDSYIQKGYPMLETTFSDGGSSEDPNVVQGHADSNLHANIAPLHEIQMTVRGDAEIGFGNFWPGDLVEIVTKGWLAFPDGKTQMRLLSMTGDHTNNVKVSLQREEKFT